jgi:hypothetical protein
MIQHVDDLLKLRVIKLTSVCPQTTFHNSQAKTPKEILTHNRSFLRFPKSPSHLHDTPQHQQQILHVKFKLFKCVSLFFPQMVKISAFSIRRESCSLNEYGAIITFVERST